MTLKDLTRYFIRLLFVFSALVLLWTEFGHGTSTRDPSRPSCTLEFKLDGAVGPATVDAFAGAQIEAEKRGCDSILFLINTPGGNLQSTRILVEKILESKIPVLCLVWPPGGHAGSAGAILLQACHVNGAGTATNIGAATPVSGSGEAIPKDLRDKLVEDTQSWVTGLARLRGRNETFAKESVTKARAIDASEAVQLKAIDAQVSTTEEFLNFARGRPVKMPGDRIEEVKVGSVVSFEKGLRHRFLDFVTDPQFAYLLFMASLALLYFELTNPGAILPGALGGIGLIISLMSFHKLDVWWGGVLLILLGMAFLIAEAFVPSFGVLGIGGLIAFIAGSVLLYDPMVIGGRLPLTLIFGIVATVGIGMMALSIYIYRTRFSKKRPAGMDEFLGKHGRVVSLESPSQRRGMLEIGGELWRFQSSQDFVIGQEAEVIANDGLVLSVKPVYSKN